jgi:cell division septation protein DedD
VLRSTQKIVSTEEGFREIQLNGKQLVFLFMAATVVLVVCFMLGVLVGRDIRENRSTDADVRSAAVSPDPVSASASQSPGSQTQPPAEPPTPAEDLSYYDRLQKNDTPPEKLKPSASAPNQVAPDKAHAAAPPPAAAEPSAADAHPAAPSSGEPTGPGFAVQVTTRPDRQAADMLVSQLIKKGYPAFVAGPVSSGGRSIYRVRVGKYKTAKEAEAVSRRLETEEQFKPWIAR